MGHYLSRDMYIPKRGEGVRSFFTKFLDERCIPYPAKASVTALRILYIRARQAGISIHKYAGTYLERSQGND